MRASAILLDYQPFVFARSTQSTCCTSPASTSTSEDSSADSTVSSPASSERADENRTTVMIRKIGKLYTQKQLLNEIIALGYDLDFVLLPPSHYDGQNRGFAVVNFTTAEGAEKFLQDFSGHIFDQSLHTNDEVCAAVLDYGRTQGLRSNLKACLEKNNTPWVKN
jgi:RNA recognition motif-containing protein